MRPATGNAKSLVVPKRMNIEAAAMRKRLRNCGAQADHRAITVCMESRCLTPLSDSLYLHFSAVRESSSDWYASSGFAPWTTPCKWRTSTLAMA